MTTMAASRFRLAMYAEALPQGASSLERFRIAADAGFEGLEIGACEDPDEVARIHEAARQTGLALHSVYVPQHWTHPLTSRRESDVATSLRATHTAFANARAWGADTVLVVPGLVTAEDSYARVYERSQELIRKELLPAAKELGITLLVENVANGFLLSPFEFARYIDELESDRVRALLDIGNIRSGHPEHWIPILGDRILKLHVKDFSNPGFGWQRTLGRGSVSWAAVTRELAVLGFAGWATNTEPNELPTRVLRRLRRELRGRGVELPRSGRRLWQLKRRFSRHSLRAAVQRCHRVLAEGEAPARRATGRRPGG